MYKHQLPSLYKASSITPFFFPLQNFKTISSLFFFFFFFLVFLYPSMMSQVFDSNVPQWKRLACPRCNSDNTKFCYYNNYSLSQPRYFCKGCKRYWTKGGSLRNIPAGGGCRRSHRPRPNRFNQTRPIIRPDLILDGIAGNVHEIDKVDDGSFHNESNKEIDLALLYAKYLNDSPALSSANSPRSKDNAHASMKVMEDSSAAAAAAAAAGCYDVLDYLGFVGDDHDQLLPAVMTTLPTEEEFTDILSLTCPEAPESNHQDFMSNGHYKAYFSSLEALCGPSRS